MFTNEVINKLDISDVRELRFESNKGVKQGTKNANKFWQTSVIQDKLKRMCQNDQVDFVLTKPAFKSQRCFKCGFVHINNREGENFECLNCHHVDDADHNSASNNNLNLPYTNIWSYRQYNRNSGFFWKEDGISVYPNTQMSDPASLNNNYENLDKNIEDFL